jgi:S1-C subfamily serine protease
VIRFGLVHTFKTEKDGFNVRKNPKQAAPKTIRERKSRCNMTKQNQTSTNRGRFALIAIGGCSVILFLVALIVTPILLGPQLLDQITDHIQGPSPVSTLQYTPAPIATFTQTSPTEKPILQTGADIPCLTELYDDLGPGVVNIRVFVEQQGLIGEGAGSGFILDQNGHIVTNDHVVANADMISVIFSNGVEVEADIVGTDPYSDLAVILVETLPDEAHPLQLGNSDLAEVGEWVIAIGNPFGQQSSMTTGIVSAVGRTIPTAETPFSIPQAIQTDAAINPGNSGGPLLNLEGQVIGVNAQIASGGISANSGVGFAIPSNIVRIVAPSLIETGTYAWPKMGVAGTDLSLLLRQANNIEIQQGAYIDSVDPDGPAAEAGMRGSTGTRAVSGVEAPVGGDVIIAADGEPVLSFSDLLADIAFKQPGEEVQLTIIRDGSEEQITITLAPRP